MGANSSRPPLLSAASSSTSLPGSAKRATMISRNLLQYHADKKYGCGVSVYVLMCGECVLHKSVDQESSLFLTMDSQTSSPVGPAA